MLPSCNYGLNKAQIRNDVRGTAGKRRGGVQHRAPFGTDAVREEQHPGAHQLPKQQKTVGESESFRPALQHGAGEREGDVDRTAQAWKGQEEGQAGE